MANTGIYPHEYGRSVDPWDAAGQLGLAPWYVLLPGFGTVVGHPGNFSDFYHPFSLTPDFHPIRIDIPEADLGTYGHDPMVEIPVLQNPQPEENGLFLQALTSNQQFGNETGLAPEALAFGDTISPIQTGFNSFDTSFGSPFGGVDGVFGSTTSTASAGGMNAGGDF